MKKCSCNALMAGECVCGAWNEPDVDRLKNLLKRCIPSIEIDIDENRKMWKQQVSDTDRIIIEGHIKRKLTLIKEIEIELKR